MFVGVAVHTLLDVGNELVALAERNGLDDDITVCCLGDRLIEMRNVDTVNAWQAMLMMDHQTGAGRTLRLQRWAQRVVCFLEALVDDVRHVGMIVYGLGDVPIAGKLECGRIPEMPLHDDVALSIESATVTFDVSEVWLMGVSKSGAPNVLRELEL